jgi:hypothetical protein
LNTWQKITDFQKTCNENLCSQLYTLIEKSSDNLEQKRLLNLKRSVYNNRQNALTMVQKIQPETFELFKEYWKNGKVQTSCIKNFAAMGSRFSELPGITQTGNPKTHWRISFPEWYFTFQ